MRKIATEIIIDAPINEVWEVLMDFESHKNWNPFIRSISGVPTPNETIEVQIIQKNDKTMKFSPIVITNMKEKEFRWKGKLFADGLFDGEHYFKLESLSSDSTKLVHGEIFTGLLANVLFKMIGEETKNGFKRMNFAIKGEVEEMYNNLGIIK